MMNTSFDNFLFKLTTRAGSALEAENKYLIAEGKTGFATVADFVLYHRYQDLFKIPGLGQRSIDFLVVELRKLAVSCGFMRQRSCDSYSVHSDFYESLRRDLELARHEEFAALASHLKNLEAEHKLLQGLHQSALTELSMRVSQARHGAEPLSDQHKAAVIQWETTMMRLVGEDGIADVEKAINKLKAQSQLVTEKSERIEELEESLVALTEINEMFATSGLETERKLLAMENAALWHNKNQPSQLDQFAMAVIRSCLQGAANQVGKRMLHEDNVVKYAVTSAYDIAEAMKAESQKRQGGAV